MRQEESRSLTVGVAVLAGALASAPWVAPARAQSSGGSIVEEAVRDAEQEQNRDSDLVRRMVDEAVKGAETAPSGREAVNPQAPDSLRPIDGSAPTTLPAGLDLEDLENQPVRDAAGSQIGTVRGVAVDEATGLPRAMVEFGSLFGEPGKTAPVEIETLTPAEGGGFVLDLTPVAYRSMPAYAWREGQWRRQDA